MRFALASLVAFLGLTLAVALRLTAEMDRSVLTEVQLVDSPALDIAGSLLTLAGRFDVTSALAVALTVVWMRREGRRGAVPLLLFVGTAIELALKLIVPQPEPPDELSRDLGIAAVPSLETPFSFPSGHLLRTTFLMGLLFPRAGVAARVVLVAFVIAMAASRVYLAQHWPSDVAGGVVLGLALVGVREMLRRL